MSVQTRILGRCIGAVQKLQLRPTFAPITYEQAKKTQPTFIYSEWLHINPSQPGRNRWALSSWRTFRGRNEDLAEENGRVRQYLRTLAIREEDYNLALERLHRSQPHERPLNEKITSLHRGEYQIEECLFPFSLVSKNIHYTLMMLISAPDYILEPIKELREDMMAIHVDLEKTIEELRRILTVRLHTILGSESFRHAEFMYRTERPVWRERDRVEAASRLLRRVEKYHRVLKGHTEDSYVSEHLSSRIYNGTREGVWNASDIDAIIIHADRQKAIALDKHPAGWVPTSFAIQLYDVMQALHTWRSQVYRSTKFPTQTDASRTGNLRLQAFLSFRRILDEWEYKLSHPYGQGSYDKLDLSTLVRQLRYIREYRIHKFPESVSKEEIALARRFHARMRRRLWSWWKPILYRKGRGSQRSPQTTPVQQRARRQLGQDSNSAVQEEEKERQKPAARACKEQKAKTVVEKTIQRLVVSFSDSINDEKQSPSSKMQTTRLVAKARPVPAMVKTLKAFNEAQYQPRNNSPSRTSAEHEESPLSRIPAQTQELQKPTQSHTQHRRRTRRTHYHPAGAEPQTEPARR